MSLLSVVYMLNHTNIRRPAGAYIDIYQEKALI